MFNVNELRRSAATFLAYLSMQYRGFVRWHSMSTIFLSPTMKTSLLAAMFGSCLMVTAAVSKPDRRWTV